MGKEVYKSIMYFFWLAGIVLIWAAYDWKAAAISWLIGSCFGTAILLEARS